MSESQQLPAQQFHLYEVIRAQAQEDQERRRIARMAQLFFTDALLSHPEPTDIINNMPPAGQLGWTFRENRIFPPIPADRYSDIVARAIWLDYAWPHSGILRLSGPQSATSRQVTFEDGDLFIEDTADGQTFYACSTADPQTRHMVEDELANIIAAIRPTPDESTDPAAHEALAEQQEINWRLGNLARQGEQKQQFTTNLQRSLIEIVAHDTNPDARENTLEWLETGQLPKHNQALAAWHFAFAKQLSLDGMDFSVTHVVVQPDMANAAAFEVIFSIGRKQPVFRFICSPERILLWGGRGDRQKLLHEITADSPQSIVQLWLGRLANWAKPPTKL